MKWLHLGIVSLTLIGLSSFETLANVPGGGTGAGPNVTLTDNGSTVTLANGIVSIVCTKSGGSINQINYTYNNGSGSQTVNLLAGGNNGGQLYWENSSNQGLSFSNAVVADPATNGGNYAEIALLTTSEPNDVLEVHYSLLRGATGFYVTAIYGHRAIDGAFGMGECRDNIYAGAMFNWMSVDSARNRLMEVSGGSAIAVQGAPKEVSLWTNGIYAGQYEDKYKYSADLGDHQVWGWSSVGAGGRNVGLWNLTASAEYYNGGPLKRELMEHIGTTVLNMLNGGHYGMGSDGNFVSGEVWTKVCGPYFIYCNQVTNTLTGANQAAQALYQDAQAQQAAEASAWPYAWFANANYTPAASRGAVTGTLAIADPGNPGASASGCWVGLIQQPATSAGVYDFQQWMKPYQFWVRTDANGSFILPNVIAGGNYTLYAFGRGAPGTFMSQAQNGGHPPLLTTLPATPFAVTVTAGATNALGTVTWVPQRTAPTVFEIGYPDRTSAKFRHGDDFWVGDIGPDPATPSPIWSKWLDFSFDFPDGLNYVVGRNRWSTDWNFAQPVVRNSSGGYDNSSSTISFSLATAPASGATASLYVGLASDYYAAVIVTVNGSNLGGVSGVTGAPDAVPASGYYAGYQDSDTTIREGNNAAFSDERVAFPASLLHAGVNTINLGIRQIGGSYFADHILYDYLRLELTGYIPPPPAQVATYPGNACNLIGWPPAPGAAGYVILRSTTPGGGYSPVASGVTGPVCGSGTNQATWLDTTAVNGVAYYYEVESQNEAGLSAASSASAPATPSAALASLPPAAPSSPTVTSATHQRVTLAWTASPGADFYAVWRSTLVNSGGGSSNVLSTILLDNSITNTSYTDTSAEDGTIYQYAVTAASAGGVSGASPAAFAVPLPGAPATLPVSLTGAFTQTNVVTLNWNAVSGAVGYAIYRATSPGGPFIYQQTITMTNYADSGLNSNTVYYYEVTSMNDGGASAPAADSVNAQQPPPASLAAVATNQQISLAWSAPLNAVSYSVFRGLSLGQETNLVVSGYSGTAYTDANLAGNTTYYYVVTASGAGGVSGKSPEAAATTVASLNGVWTAAAGGVWSQPANWRGGIVASGAGGTADFSQIRLTGAATVNLDSSRALGTLIFGDAGDAYPWWLTSTNTLTLAPAPVVDVVNQSVTINAALAGSGGLAKTGPGALTLGGATNSITGGAAVLAGTLTLDFSAALSPAADLLPAANALLLDGGALQINGNPARVSTQSFAATTLGGGEATVSAAPASGPDDPVVNLGTVTASAGGVVEFIGPAATGAGGGAVAASALLTTTNAGANAFVGTGATAFLDANFATVGLYDFAAAVGASPPFTVVGGSQIAGFYTPASGNTAVASGNLDVTGNLTGWSAQPYLTTLRCNTSLGADQTISASGKASTLTLADILVTPNVGPYQVIFNSGGFRPGSDSLNPVPFVIWQNNAAGELVLNTLVNNSKAGASAYVQSGPGTVNLASAANGYSGQSYLNGGVTLIAGNGSLGSAAAGAAVNLNGGTLAATATLALDNAGISPRPVNLLGNGGGLAAVSNQTFTVDGVISGGANSGPLVIGLPGTSANGGTAGLVPGTGPGTANATPLWATGAVILTNANTYSGGTRVDSGALVINGLGSLGGALAGGVTLNGGTLQFASGLTGANGSADLTTAGGSGLTLASDSTLDLNGNAVTFAHPFGSQGTGSLTVASSAAGGSLTLSAANDYQGATLVTNASLFLANPAGSATGTGDVTVENTGVLGGVGTLAGSVTVAAGGTLAPGDLGAPLSIGGNLTLPAGSATMLQLRHSPLAASGAVIAGSFAAGGSLLVTNAGGPLTAGDTFTLFQAAGYQGGFASVTLPPLTGSLAWNTNALASLGRISIINLSAPSIAAARISGASLTFGGSGGPAGWSYVVQMTTNLPAGWVPVATNAFDASGNFSLTLTNALTAGQGQAFYRLKLQ